jgi:GGDEF domain-containing protein
MKTYDGQDVEKRSIYPPEINTPEQKAEYLKDRHPDLSLSIDIAKRFDQDKIKIDPSSPPIATEKIVKFIEDVMYDPLLGENIYTFHDFQEHIKEDKIDRLYMIDVKIKEINDVLGTVKGDRALENCWDQIKEAIGDENMKQFVIGRYGGTYMLGLRKGHVLDSSVQKKLAKINGISFNNSYLPVAHTSRPISKTFGDSPLIEKNKALRQELDLYFNDLNRDWVMRVFTEFESKGIPDIDESIHRMRNQTPTEQDLLLLYFAGKRIQTRLPSMLSYCHLIESTGSLEARKISDMFNAIYKRFPDGIVLK